MSKALALITSTIVGVFPTLAFADAAPPVDPSTRSAAQTPSKKGAHLKAFTGKIIGNNVRMRTAPDLASHIISELSKDDYVVVEGQNGEFYAIGAPSHLKAYIFRGFVIDDVVEGNRVNVRLAPDRDAPIIGHYSTGHPIHGKICENNNKWLEIDIPKESRFYIAKEYVEYAGNPELKAIQDKRRETVTQLLESTKLLSQGEMRKAFPEIDIDKINKISGMDITFVTTADTDKEAKSLLTELGLPFQKN